MDLSDFLREAAEGRRDGVEFYLFESDRIVGSWLVQEVVRAKEAKVKRLKVIYSE
jgi:hypothetical protein